MHIKKDEMIYKQGSKSEFFYGIINGKVGVLKKKVIGADPNQQHVSFNSPAKQQVDRSIRRSTTIKFQRQGTLTKTFKKESEKQIILNPTKKGELVNQLVMIKGPGECFGYDGLINKAYRTSTTISVTDVDLFTLNQEFFDKSFNKSILRSTVERKEFLMNRIEAFRENKSYFESRFKYIKTHNKENNEVLYIEGASATSIWLVYYGECTLLKNTEKLKEGEEINPTKQTSVLNLVRGGFAGFEALTNGTKYAGTLVSKSVYTIVLEIKINELIDLKAPFIKCLENISKQLDQITTSIIETKIYNRKNKKVVFNQEVTNNIIKFNDSFRDFEVNINKLKEIIPYKPHNKTDLDFTFQLSEQNLNSTDNTHNNTTSTLYKNKGLFSTVSEFESFKLHNDESKKNLLNLKKKSKKVIKPSSSSKQIPLTKYSLQTYLKSTNNLESNSEFKIKNKLNFPQSPLKNTNFHRRKFKMKTEKIKFDELNLDDDGDGMEEIPFLKRFESEKKFKTTRVANKPEFIQKFDLSKIRREKQEQNTQMVINEILKLSPPVRLKDENFGKGILERLRNNHNNQKQVKFNFKQSEDETQSDKRVSDHSTKIELNKVKSESKLRTDSSRLFLGDPKKLNFQNINNENNNENYNGNNNGSNKENRVLNTYRSSKKIKYKLKMNEDSFLISDSIQRTVNLTPAATSMYKNYNSGIFQIPLVHLIQDKENKS